MKIGITGGAGFIGGYVAQVALERGHQVVIFDRTARHPAAYDTSMVRFMGDVRDATAMTELAAHVDGIIHLAACLGTQETIQNPRPAAETNIVGGLNFLEACTQYDIPGVYIGVGNHWMDNTYSITKTTVERFVRMFNAERNRGQFDNYDGARFNIVRLVNAYGPGQSVAPPFGPAKVRKITPSFVCRALAGKPIEVYGDGSQVSDMVYVRDGAEALVRALEAAADGIVFDRPVEVGSVTPVTVQQVAETVRAIVANKRASAGMPHEAVDIVHLPMRPGETPGTPVVADTSTLEFVGMDPADLIRLGPGLEATIDWYTAHWLPGYLTAQVARREPLIDLFSRKATVHDLGKHICTESCGPLNCQVWEDDGRKDAIPPTGDWTTNAELTGAPLNLDDWNR
jgi:nucleoside-diphosphate-sugar epimerase